MKPLFDANFSKGLFVRHFLVIEYAVTQEMQLKKTPQQVTPLGAHNVLRTRFPIQVIRQEDDLPAYTRK
jgi:hypothetical protein